MKLKMDMMGAMLAAGAVCGLISGLCMHWFIVGLLYEKTYGFEFSPALSNVLNPLAGLALPLAALGIGPLALWWWQEQAPGWKRAALAGAGAGSAAAVINYLAIGALATVIVYGIIPFITYLVEPGKIAEVGIEALMQQIVGEAIPGAYQVMLGYLATFALLGALEGLVFEALRAWRRKRAADAPVEPPAA